MKFFLDTANLESIKKYASWEIIDGITTNPSLIAKEGKDLKTTIKSICKIHSGIKSISCEVSSENAKEMIKEGKEFAKWHKNIYVKVPATIEGLKACKALSKIGIRVNVTLIFNSAQAIMAAKAGASFVSPFIGRLDDISQDGMALIKEIVRIFENYNFKTEVLVASVRHPRHVIESALIGADIVTMPEDVIEKLIHHPLTEIGLMKFASDSKKMQKSKKLL